MNNLIYDNSAINGGGVRFCYFLVPGHEPVVANNVIVDNHGENGGGVHVFEAYPTLLHNTISGNEAANGGGLFVTSFSSPIFIDSILWGDSAPTGLEIYIDATSSLDIDYCDVQGGEESVFQEPGSSLLWGEANFDVDPLFSSPSDFDYHLRPASPCIDIGIYVRIDEDMDGDPRPLGVAVDVGADEVSVFTLDLDAFYDGSELALVYTLGTPEPATWANYLIVTYPMIQVFPLGTAPLPAIDPPMEITISFPFPSVGWIGIYSGLFTSSGAEAVVLEWINTGG